MRKVTHQILMRRHPMHGTPIAEVKDERFWISIGNISNRVARTILKHKLRLIDSGETTNAKS